VHFAHIEENVNMIGNATNNDPRRIETADNRRQVSMNSRPDFIVKKWFAVLGAEDQMGVELRERLRHESAPKALH
jgi:hypothetical protein